MYSICGNLKKKSAKSKIMHDFKDGDVVSVQWRLKFSFTCSSCFNRTENLHTSPSSTHTHAGLERSAFHQRRPAPAGSSLTVYNPLSEQMDVLPKRSFRAKHGQKTRPQSLQQWLSSTETNLALFQNPLRGGQEALRSHLGANEDFTDWTSWEVFWWRSYKHLWSSNHSL